MAHLYAVHSIGLERDAKIWRLGVILRRFDGNGGRKGVVAPCASAFPSRKAKLQNHSLNKSIEETDAVGVARIL